MRINAARRFTFRFLFRSHRQLRIDCGSQRWLPTRPDPRVAASRRHEGAGDRALDICHHSPLRHQSPVVPSPPHCLNMPARGLLGRRQCLKFSTTTTFPMPMGCIYLTYVRLLAPPLPPLVIACSIPCPRPGFVYGRLNNDEWRQLDDARSVRAATCDVHSPI